MTRYCSGPQYINEPDLPEVGSATVWHDHEFPHTSFVHSGRALVELANDDRTQVQRFEISASDQECWKLVPARVWHRMTALEPGTRIFCVFADYAGMFATRGAT